MQVASINSVRMHYRDEGVPGGLALVFSNSLGTDLRIWDAVLPHLPEGLRIIRYDTRGHGLSDAPDGGYFMGDLVGDAAELIEHLGLRDVVFAGLSIGGMIAQGLAAERPDLVRAMILLGTAAKIGTEEFWEERMRTVRQGGIGAISDGILERWFSRKFRAEKQDEMAAWAHMLERTPVAGYLGCCAALAGTDLRESTALLDLPVLALAGSEDGATPPDLVREMAQSIAGARFEIIHGAGHIPCIEQPEKLAMLMGAFLKETGHG
jgi:3-oxoadipate enol-lactonase